MTKKEKIFLLIGYMSSSIGASMVGLGIGIDRPISILTGIGTGFVVIGTITFSCIIDISIDERMGDNE